MIYTHTQRIQKIQTSLTWENTEYIEKGCGLLGL